MPPLSFWKGPGAKTKDYMFFDRQAAEYINIGSTEVYVHKYLGPSNTVDGINTGVLTIEDLVNLEIRDRKYDPDVYSLRGHYLVTDTEFDLKQFGLFLSSDTVFITFHLNQMTDKLGRRLMSGDVLELLHWRDTGALDGKVTNKFYVVEEGTKPAEGFSVSWWPHLWRVKCQPLTDSQEFQDILDQSLNQDRGDGVPTPGLNEDGTDPTIGSVNSTYDKAIEINDAILAEAQAAVPFRNLQGAHFYVQQKDLDIKPSIFLSDGIPPNDSRPVPSGTSFPADSNEGDWFLRLDYLPPVLFKRSESSWRRVESNWRAPWLPAGRVLASFINNKLKTRLEDGTTPDQRQGLRGAVKPKFDPDIT